MAGAAFQEFGFDRQGAFKKVEDAKSVAEALAILKSLRASEGHTTYNKIGKMVGAAY